MIMLRGKKEVSKLHLYKKFKLGEKLMKNIAFILLFSLPQLVSSAQAAQFQVRVPISSTSLCSILLSSDAKKQMFNALSPERVLTWGTDNFDILKHFVAGPDSGFRADYENRFGVDDVLEAAQIKAIQSSYTVLTQHLGSKTFDKDPELKVWALTEQNGHIVMGITFRRFPDATLENLVPAVQEAISKPFISPRFATNSWVISRVGDLRNGNSERSLSVVFNAHVDSPESSFHALGALVQQINLHINQP
jgi:hypothetical protein